MSDSKQRQRERSQNVSFWVTPKDFELYAKLAEMEDSNVSQIIRTTMRRALVGAGLVKFNTDTENA